MKTSDAWDFEWQDRTHPDGTILRNVPKLKYLCKKLWDRPYLIPMKKLEIGCGECIHVRSLGRFCAEWKQDYVGIDVSEYIIQRAKEFGVEAYAGDFLTFDFNRKFNLFLFLDVLEHMEDWKSIAKKVRQLALDDLVIIGNVPMGPPEDTKYDIIKDKPITLLQISSFVHECGCLSMDYEIHETFGYPFLFFEATNYVQ